MAAGVIRPIKNGPDLTSQFNPAHWDSVSVWCVRSVSVTERE